MNIFLVVLLVIVGVLLMVAEVYLLPGFGVAGIGGVASLIGAVVLGYTRFASVWVGHLTLLSCVVLTVLAIYLFYRSKAMDKMALDATIDSTVGLADPGKKIEKLEKEAKEMEEASE